MPTKYDVLKQYFGHTSFRKGQEELIDAILSRRDALGIMPTGGGKSICYQIPALLLDGITIVISPLISLMKDQVMALKTAGIPAAYLNSSLSYAQMQKVCCNLSLGAYKIVYVAPERLETEEFIALARTLRISLIAVDEAHCISQWGQDFRPSYLKIISFLNALGYRPTLAAFTATATEQVREDIARILALQNPFRIVTGFDRPNLSFEIGRKSPKREVIYDYLTEHPDKSGIIYCSTRSAVEKVCDALCEKGFPATRYHAGLDDSERRQNQEDFIRDLRPIMVATNAFGMGIDKSNVSFVIHYNMPLSLEAYYQEAGRAGRDGERADCILLYSASDLYTARKLIELSGESDALDEAQKALLLRQNYARLEQMVGYCKTTDCLRGYILDYFGQAHDERCGNCGNCRTVFTEEDVTVDAQKVLSCIRRAKSALGYSVGKVLIARILLGSRDKRISELGLDTLSTYGIMKDSSRTRVRDLIDRLELLGYIAVDPEHGAAETTPAADRILFGGEKLTMSFTEEPRKKKKEKAKDADLPQDERLFEQLRQLRFRIAQEEGVPPYIIFSNATLSDMAVKKPTTLSALLEVSGVGSVKAERYGRQFVELIANSMI